MFSVGNYVIYGNAGVCRVEKIGCLDMDGISRERSYYTLVPVYGSGGVIYTPADHSKVVIRPVISPEEAKELVEEMPDMELLGLKEDKSRERVLKEAVQSCSSREWIKLIKTVYIKNFSRLESGKKMTFSDEKYLRMAEEFLFGELATACGMDRDKVRESIISKVKALEES